LKAETKLNQSQISAKYLINFTPNCFAWAAAVISVELGSSIAEKFSKFFHLCAIQSILHKPANSVQNSHVQNYRILASLVVVVREGGEKRDTWGHTGFHFHSFRLADSQCARRT